LISVAFSGLRSPYLLTVVIEIEIEIEIEIQIVPYDFLQSGISDE
jgi:hypothetical protein